MNAGATRSFYTKRLEEVRKSLGKVRSAINLVSNTRLAIVIAGIVLAYFAWERTYLFYALPLAVIIFVALVQRHSRLFDQKVYFESLVRICENELRALDGDFSAFDAGREFVDPHHHYTHDLDIFGDASLYQALTRCNTIGGRRRLAEMLSVLPESAPIVNERQQAVRELAAFHDIRHEVQARGMVINEMASERSQLEEWTRHKPFLYGKKIYPIVLTFVPALTIGLLGISFVVDGAGRLFWISAIAQWIFLGFHLKKINAFHQYVSRKKEIISRYARILEAVEGRVFQSSLLRGMASEARDAHKKLSGLATLTGALDARLNSMTNIVVNSLVMYDMQLVIRLEKWKEENAGRLVSWLAVVDEIEVLSSFGTFAFNNPDFNYPHLNMDRRFVASSMGHPLISSHERVVNDVALDSERAIMIVTGANMAGKSTFLRTLGVNVVLALNGAPVCAAHFDCPVIGICSGMRTADSLHDHQSYFYAELNRLRFIMNELSRGKELLVLLDEILKGTNSKDKQTGSVALVRQLVNRRLLLVVATHDLALGELEKEFPGKISNYCFEARIENDELSFDYKLKPGVAKNLNATFLMKKMGIIPQSD